MKNSEIEAAWHYHNGTKHPAGILMNRSHSYGALLRPPPYKIYYNIPKIKLPIIKESSYTSALDAISIIPRNEKDVTPNMDTLSQILFFSAGITKTIRYPDPVGEVDFRAASCTGALYHIEVYVVCSTIPGLAAGVYHFDPKEMRLDLLRDGDFRQVISESTLNEPFVKHSPIILVFTDVFSRNSIKYQAREYRHAFWDCGTILANTLAITSGHGLPSRVVMGFVDSQIDHLLGLDSSKEAALVILPVGISPTELPIPPTVSDLDLKTNSSDYDIDNSEINAMHDSGCLSNKTEVKSWRKQMEREEEIPSDLIYLKENIVKKDSIEDVIYRRGSTRNFSQESITFDELSTILNLSTTGIDSDYGTTTTMLCDLYLIVNAVDGLASGSYHYVKNKNALELLRKGNFRQISGNLGLDQDLPRDAAVTIFFTINLQKILEHFGNRGYRIAQLDASITGGRIYLAAYALGLGATGLTFYDDAVTEFFSPHTKNQQVMFLTAIGKRKKQLHR